MEEVVRKVGLMGMKDRYEGSEKSGFDGLTDDHECGLSSVNRYERWEGGELNVVGLAW